MLFSNNVSDESDDEIDNSLVDPYRRKYQLISERCEVLQQDNERLVHRIQQVKKELRRTKKERKFILDRLEQHNDDWKNVPITLPMEEVVTGAIKPSRPPVGQKRKASVKLTDPNAPKRPANPFFQFCQEQRSKVIERLSQELKEGEVEPSKQDVTKHLANKWNSLNSEEKKIYYTKYETSREKYAAAILIYKQGTENPD